MKGLTERQQEILDLIKDQLSNTGLPPTRADIARILGFKSPNAAEQHLRAIEKKGFIKIIAGASRGIVLNLEEDLGIPIIGLVAAGGPILAQENIEKRIPQAQNILSSKVDYYLRVKGDSMVDVGIYEDDLIGVNKNNPIKVGSIVVARIGEEVTVKTLESLSSAEVILKAENTNYSNINLDPKRDELVFEGTCVGLLRDFS
jgi:repressor LexA|tara:strand:- start:103 stop:708 length:606 start_codon:yes stop_codon:yes gene_type:complete